MLWGVHKIHLCLVSDISQWPNGWCWLSVPRPLHLLKILCNTGLSNFLIQNCIKDLCCCAVIFQVPRRVGSVLSRLLRRDCVKNGEEREAELHLYAVSQTSRLYLHLQSLWNSSMIVSDDCDTHKE